MAVITSGDGVASATITMTQDTDGVYAISVSAVTPANSEIAFEIGNERIWQGFARTDEQSG